MDTTKINHLSLCSGYGGIDLGLGAVLPDVRTVAYVEVEAFAVANLVAKIEEGGLDEAPIWTDIKTFDAKPFCGKVDILSGGFPCQPFSQAGRRKSDEDPRHLFPSIERIITECKPRIVFLENVEGIISSKLGGEPDTSVLKYVLERLENLGYYCEAELVSASEVSAPHRRKRVFILGISNSVCERYRGRTESVGREGEASESDHGDSVRCEVDGLCSLGDTQHTGRIPATNRGGDNEDGSRSEEGSDKTIESERASRQEINGDLRECQLAQPCNEGLQGDELKGTHRESPPRGEEGTHRTTSECCEVPRSRWGQHFERLFHRFPSRPNEEQYEWEQPRVAKPRLGGVSNGSSARVDRLRMLGNGVVPQTCSKAFLMLMSKIIGDMK